MANNTPDQKTLDKAAKKLEAEAFAKQVRKANKLNEKKAERKEIRNRVRADMDGKR